jgi:WD40 repeat protein
VDAQTGESELLGRHKDSARWAVFSPDGAYLFTGGWERELVCWDARTKRRMFTASLNSYLITFSGDGRRCAVITPTTAQLHAFERPAAHREFTDYLGVGLRLAAISPDGRWLAASDAKGSRVWDLTGVGPSALITNTSHTHFYFTPDGSEMFGSRALRAPAGGFRWQVTPATNPAAPPVLTPLPLHAPERFTSLCLISNSVVMTSTNGTQMLTRAEFESGSKRWAVTSAGINGVSRDGRWLGIRQHWGSTLDVYRLPGLQRVAKLSHPVGFADFQFSPSGDEVAISSDNAASLTTVWSTTTWERTRMLTNFIRVLYTPDLRMFWVTHDSREAGLYNARTIEPRLLLPKGMLPLALSPDGRHLAVSVDARRLQLWDLSEIHKQLHNFGLDWVD